jgi:protochlorophyllide reductase
MPRPSRWTSADIGDQSNTVALVTGANSGLGFETAMALAAHGATVIMAARNRERLDAAVAAVAERHSGAHVEGLILDLASVASIREAAEEVLQAHPRLDVLINNAGVMAIPRAETVDGFEMQFGTNHLGHFALTGLLLPALIATPGSRVVSVTSEARKIGRIDLGDLHGRRHYGRWKAYGQSKLANLIFVQELDRRFRAAKAETIAVAAHPGYAATNLQTGSNWLQNTYYSIGNLLLAQSAADGAWPQLFAATAEGVPGGALYGPGQMGGSRGYPMRNKIEARALDADVARRLWDVSVQETGVDYSALKAGGTSS